VALTVRTGPALLLQLLVKCRRVGLLRAVRHQHFHARVHDRRRRVERETCEVVVVVVLPLFRWHQDCAGKAGEHQRSDAGDGDAEPPHPHCPTGPWTTRSAPTSHHLNRRGLAVLGRASACPRATRATNRSPSACPWPSRRTAWCAVDNDLIEFEACPASQRSSTWAASAQPECDSSIGAPRAPASGRPLHQAHQSDEQVRPFSVSTYSLRERCRAPCRALLQQPFAHEVPQLRGHDRLAQCRTSANWSKRWHVEGSRIKSTAERLPINWIAVERTTLSRPGIAVFECPPMSLHSCEAPHTGLRTVKPAA